MPKQEDPRKDWCEEHWNFVVEKRLNGIMATLLMHKKLLEDKHFIKLCGGKVEHINDQMKKIRPLCCYLGDEVMEEIFKECKLPHQSIDGYA